MTTVCLWTRWMLFTAWIMAACLPVLVGCEQRNYRIHMREHEGVASRTFLDSDPSRRDLETLSDRYGHSPERDEPTGDFRFQAEFESDLPRELGGRNGWSRFDGAFGHTTMWYEITAPHANAWPRLVQRVESGILWLRIVKLWAIEYFGEDRAEAIEDVFENQVVPGVIDGYLRFVGVGPVIASQRVGLSLRREENKKELTADEFFRLEVLVPVIFSMAADAPMEPDELHLGFILGMDGSASREERRKAWQRSGEDVALRFIQQFDPERTSVSMGEIRSWGISIMLFALQTNKYKELLLDSPAVSEADKETIRSGGIVLPPAPFGVQILNRASPDQATIDLEPAAMPFLSNGVLIEADEREELPSGDTGPLLRFRMPIRKVDDASLFGTPPAYAFWSKPDAGVQEAIFGAVTLQGRALGIVCGWEHMMSEDEREQWRSAVLEAVRNRSREPLKAVLGVLGIPAPTALQSALEIPPASQKPVEGSAPETPLEVPEGGSVVGSRKKDQLRLDAGS